MPGPTENQLRSAVDDLKKSTAPADTVGVEWRDAAPAARPEGIAWSPEPGRLTYDLWSGQRRTLDALRSGDPDLVAFLAGYGSGKSVFGARWLLAQACQHPGSRFLAMGISYQKARASTYPKLFANLPGERTDLVTTAYNGPETSPLVTDYNRAEHRLTLVNNAEIVLGSADSYNRYAGAEFGAIWMDEPSHYGDVLHDLTGMMTTRLRGVDGPKQMLWTLTGEGYNAAWEILEKRQDGDGEPLGLDVDVVRASVLENPYLTDGEKERFKRKYGGTEKAEQALHGGFAAASGLVYSAFSRDTHVVDAADARERVVDGWRIYGYDAGWNDPRVLLEIGKTARDQLVVLDEFHESGTHVEDAIRWLDTNDKPEGPIYAEHVPAELEKFERAGWQTVKAEKDIDAGLSEVRRRLQPDGNIDVPDGGGGDVFAFQSDNHARTKENVVVVNHRGVHRAHDRDDGSDGDGDGDHPDAPDGAVGLLVASACSQLIREFLGYKEEHVGTSQATDHCLDSLRYACMGA
jgi:hypothetical protein